MSLKARIERLERLHRSELTGTPTMAVLDRIVNDTITEEEFARYTPFWEKLFSDDTPACKTGAQSV